MIKDCNESDSTLNFSLRKLKDSSFNIIYVTVCSKYFSEIEDGV